PPVLALGALEAALDVFDGISIEQIRTKSKALGSLFVDVVMGAGVADLDLASPGLADDRGAQISLRHPRAPELLAAAARQGVVGDLRPPALCRFGLSPLALCFEDVFRGALAVVEAARAVG
ncbi:MAG TPA: hypothetical protein VND62_04270, partial [Acidimicrobiales bacterium]|nr:hypothetical protein [Acidimicrobiales bacterium]